MSKATIVWSKIDEAPALATYSLLPIVQKFAEKFDVNVESRDISLAGRIIATMGEFLKDEQKIEDELAYLGELVEKPEANVIKLPNISASIPQLKEAIAELQSQGYELPNYPEEPANEEESRIKDLYSKCLGSAVNPVLRQGNSDRRAADVVKKFAQKNPHKLRPIAEDCKAKVAFMNNDDFYENEQSVITEKAGKVTIELNGKVLKELDDVEDKEILSSSFMNVRALSKFLTETIEEAKEKDLLWSLHLKATMMKVSDPIIFGHAVSVFFNEVFKKYAPEFAEIGVNPDLGLGDLYKKLEKLPADKKAKIEKAIMDTYNERPNIAMVDSDNGITNLHASNDIIIDASMPPVIRDGAKMWNKDGKTQETLAVIPDRTFATMYDEILEDVKANGQFDVSTMGHVSNVGLMAKKAEEYGSHPTTFKVAENGLMEVKDEDGKVLMSHKVEEGDIWRLYRAKDIPVKDWIRLAHERGAITGQPIVFWLDSFRPHDANLIKKVVEYLPTYLAEQEVEYHILAPRAAMRYTLRRTRRGLNTISVSGNAIRDYLTDLFPILELGTSAKMMSIVPLLAGGGMFETGAGGSAPKHVEQFLQSGHLRWDSLGEFLALAESLRMIGKNGDSKIQLFANAVDKANAGYLDNNKVPSRKVGENDNKASHYYWAMYLAEALATQTEDKELAETFEAVLKELKDFEDTIIKELLAVEGKETNIGGYYHPNDKLAYKAMRPSETLNKIIDKI